MRLISRSFGDVEGILTLHPLQRRLNADQTWPPIAVVSFDHALFTRPQVVITNSTWAARRQDGNDVVTVLFAQRIRIMLHHSAPPSASTSALPPGRYRYSVGIDTPVCSATSSTVRLPSRNNVFATATSRSVMARLRPPTRPRARAAIR